MAITPWSYGLKTQPCRNTARSLPKNHRSNSPRAEFQSSLPGSSSRPGHRESHAAMNRRQKATRITRLGTTRPIAIRYIKGTCSNASPSFHGKNQDECTLTRRNRVVSLSTVLLEILRAYRPRRRGGPWFFPSWAAGQWLVGYLTLVDHYRPSEPPLGS